MAHDSLFGGLIVLVALLLVYLNRRRFHSLVRPSLPTHRKEDDDGSVDKLNHFAPTGKSQDSRSLLWVLVPSFVSYALFASQRAASPAGPRHDTSYLDGLRGLGSWIVFNTHTLGIGNKHLTQAYGATPQDNHAWQMPILRAVHNGVFGVAIFFVVSGVALSLAAVRAMEDPQRASSSASSSFHRSLGAAILKRPVRLYLPAWLCVVPTVLCVRLGVFDAVRPFADDIFGHLGESSNVFKPEASWAAELRKMLASDLRMLHVFRESFWMTFASPYKIQLWTIPIEFRASLVLYLTHAALFFVPRRRRLGCVAAAICVALLADNYDLILFWSGYLLAEHLVRTSHTLDVRPRGRRDLWLLLVLLAACYVGAMPSDGNVAKSPYYSWIVGLTPPFYTEPLRFWSAIGASLVVYVGGASRPVNDFLSSPPIRYLGRISFGLYLMHTDVNIIFGWPLLWFLWHKVFSEDGVGRALGFAVGYPILVAVQVCMADFFMRVIDQPSLRLAKRVAKRLTDD